MRRGVMSYEARLTGALESCSRRLKKLTKRQAALRQARLKASLGVPDDVVAAELRAALAERGKEDAC